MEKPRLLKDNEVIQLTNIEGFAYIKNSDGRTGNLTLFNVVHINTKDNSIKEIFYEINMFKRGQADHVQEGYSVYKTAVERYNQLAEEFNGYREI